MARKLKTFTTSAGFFDLAIAAPSMKAAAEAWGARENIFKHGFARLSDDPAIVAATMAKPGVILRRPVGTADAFSEHPTLPKNLADGEVGRPSVKHTPKKTPPSRPADAKTAGAAGRAFEKEQKRRESARRKEKAARETARARRERAIAAAEASFEVAERDHEERVSAIEKSRASLERQSDAEEARWRKKKDELQALLRRVRTAP